MSDQLSDNAKVAMNKIVDRFKSGDIGPLIEVIRLRRDKNDTPFGAWSLSNQLLAFMQTGETDCRGFRQWEQVGRKVKKGAKAAYILGPLMRKITDQTTGEERMLLYGFRGISVFPLSMTEGDELVEADYKPTEFPPLIHVAEIMGISVKYQPTGAAYGWYSGKPGHEQIVLGTWDYGTFFHELAHAAHNRIEKLKGGQDVDQEVIAEFTACVLQQLYGIDYTGNAWQYIRSYAPTDPLKAVVRCLSTIEKVLAVIFEVKSDEDNYLREEELVAA